MNLNNENTTPIDPEAIIAGLRHQLAVMTNRVATVEEMAERAERKGYTLRPEDVLAALDN